jgi:hypothetical protein
MPGFVIHEHTGRHHQCMSFKVTTNHNEIKKWITEHGGVPALSQESPDADENALRIKFDAASPYRDIGWTEFFDRFESDKLALSYSDYVIKGDEELSFNFINREVAEGQRDNKNELPEDNEIADENMFPTQSDI